MMQSTDPLPPMIRPILQGSKRAITKGQLADEREVDVLGRDTNLDDFLFPVMSIEWHGGEPNDEQLVDVLYENTFTTSRSMRETLINTLWEPDYVQLVDRHVKHECSDGFLYEIQWLPHKQKISELLPQHGTCYTLVSAFLLREQERHDAAELDEDSEEHKTDGSDDDLTDMEPVNVEVILNRAPSAANVPNPSVSSDNDITLDKFSTARTMFKDMYNARRSDSAARSSDPGRA
eukprot:g5722.t1